MSEPIGLTVKQAARSLAIGERTVRRWVREGRLSGHKVSRGNLSPEWRIDPDSVRRVAADVADDAQRTGPTATASGRPADTTGAEMLEEVRSLREENAQYRDVIRLQAQATEDLRAQVLALTDGIAALGEQVQRLLPSGREPEAATTDAEENGSWWRRLWRSRT